MRERELLNWTLDVAARFGWKVWHVPAPMKQVRGQWVGAPEAAGLADLVMLHDDPPRLIFAELKGTGGKVSLAQREFLQAARNVADRTQQDSLDGKAVGVYVFTPDNRDAIEQILRGRTA